MSLLIPPDPTVSEKTEASRRKSNIHKNSSTMPNGKGAPCSLKMPRTFFRILARLGLREQCELFSDSAPLCSRSCGRLRGTNCDWQNREPSS
eukprot:5628374-Amphidinium_carterae.1